jgi:hypothetical protein
VRKSSGCGKRTEKNVPFGVRNNPRLVSADRQGDAYPVGI